MSLLAKTLQRPAICAACSAPATNPADVFHRVLQPSRLLIKEPAGPAAQSPFVL